MKNMKFRFRKLWVFTLLVLAFTACKEEETIVGSKPVAEAGDNMTISLGSTVSLNGSSSSDADGDPLTYEWLIVSQPATSTVTISSATSVTASFTPDVVGIYTVQLTVNDGNNAAVSDQITITVEEPSAETVIIDASINSDETWIDIFDDPTIPDYRIERSIGISAVLTIAPGVIVEVNQNLGISVNQGGALIADGTTEKPIKFTSSNTAGDLKWKGIYVESADQRNILNNVTVEYGGVDSYLYLYNSINAYVSANLSLDDDAKITIANSTFSNSDDAGIVGKPDAEILSFESVSINNNAGIAMLVHPNMVEMVNNSSSFSGNNTDAVAFYSGDLTNGAESTWNELQVGNFILGLGSLGIQNLATFNPGVSIEMAQDYFINVLSSGVLIAEGTVSKSINIDAYNSQNGLKWGGLFVASADSRNKLNFVNISNGGGDDMGYIYDGINAYVTSNVFIDDNGKLAVTNTNVSSSDGYGLGIQDGGTLTEFSNNSFESNSAAAVLTTVENLLVLDGATTFSNNVENAVKVYNSTVSIDGTIPKLDNSGFYLINNNITIAADIIVEAGAVFHMEENVFVNVSSAGSLKAIGSISNMITFTSANEAGNIHWGGIFFDSGSSLNELDYVDVSYAGSDDMHYFYGSFNQYVQSNIGLSNDAVLTINNCAITNSLGYGITVEENGSVNNYTVNTAGNVAAITGVNSFSSNTSGTIAFED